MALGANPNAVNSDGQAPLHIAVQKYIQMNSDRNDRKAQNKNINSEEEIILDEDDEIMFEDLKKIMKELLFNGAFRTLKGRFELNIAGGSARGSQVSTHTKDVTPLELLEQFQEELPSHELRSLSTILVTSFIYIDNFRQRTHTTHV